MGVYKVIFGVKWYGGMMSVSDYPIFRACQVPICDFRGAECASDQFRGFAVTVTQAVDLVGRYQEAGVQLFIRSLYRNDRESMELLASEVMPHFT